MQEPPKPEHVLFSLGPYQVVKPIGKGGMGEVFLAYDSQNKRMVALKRLRTDIENKSNAREQFLQEAHYTTLLSHPSIIQIHSIVSEGDQVYYTMPFIEGHTLHEMLKYNPQNSEDPPTVSTLCPIFLDICQALAYAHSKGFIHRDLKPSNIMIDSNHKVFILDWGLIMPSENSKNKEIQDTLSGSIPYIAPEVIFGTTPNNQSEIYSLGMIFYQMLTLRHPFHRNNLEEYYEKINKEVLVDPAEVAPFRNISPQLSKIALKCLDSNPLVRYQTVEELMHDLECTIEENRLNSDPLLIPDSLLEQKQYGEALKAYRQIATTHFHTETGRTAGFQAGITLLQKAKESQRKVAFNQAEREFEKLSGTSAGPLAFLGKALIYQEQKQYEREASILEEAFHHYPKHPLLKQLHMHLSRRLSECTNLPLQQSTYFYLLAAKYLPIEEASFQIEQQLMHFKAKLDPLFFFEGDKTSEWGAVYQRMLISIHTAFLLGKSDILLEIFEDALKMTPVFFPLLQNVLFGLLELGEYDIVQLKLDLLFQRFLEVQAVAKFELIHYACLVHKQGFSVINRNFFNKFPKDLSEENLQSLWHIMEEALLQKKTKVIHLIIKQLSDHSFSFDQLYNLDCYQIWALLLEKDATSCKKIFNLYPVEQYQDKPISLNFLYGCWLAKTKGKKAALDHFSLLDRKSLPESWIELLEGIKSKKTMRIIGLQPMITHGKNDDYIVV